MSVMLPLPTTYIDRDYQCLYNVLMSAYQQASAGKGKERHANDKPFDRQPIMEIGRMVGPGYALGQAMKKCQESLKLLTIKGKEAAQAELFGAINYIAAASLLIGYIPPPKYDDVLTQMLETTEQQNEEQAPELPVQEAE